MAETLPLIHPSAVDPAEQLRRRQMAQTLQHPFQCLALAKPPGASDAYLLAACGVKLTSTSLGQDATQFEWTAAPSDSQGKDEKTDEQPAKKQKTAMPASASLNVIKLTVSPNNRYAVVITEDKLVRVFEISSDGRLTELSQRALPKRPCAIQVLPDNSTIICGDKFGDVYSLPLLPVQKLEDPEAVTGADAEEVEKQPQAFKPSASNTTVHTKRNRKALEAQLKQKNLTAKIKEPLKFEHKLLLGHVSMLTDLRFAAREVDGKQRTYIITADRDEHIRISRGPPQSHIIEGYCLGHEEYVSKICLVPGTDLLVSGGGDDWIGVWNWPSFTLKKKIDVAQALKTALEGRSEFLGFRPPQHINVSGIWILPLKIRPPAPIDGPETVEKPVTEPLIVVACEGYPTMLACPAADLLRDDAQLQHICSFESYPILDLASGEGVSVVSIDDRRYRGKRVWDCGLECDWDSKAGTIEFSYGFELARPLYELNGVAAGVENEKALDGLLYGVANLRKRGHQNGEDGGGAVEGVAVDEAEEGQGGDAD